jgi:uncharacterized protein
MRLRSRRNHEYCSPADLVAGLSRPYGGEGAGAGEPGTEPRGRGRPKLGMISREVTLAPRHWAWLARPSIALRKLVDEAGHSGADKEQTRLAREAAYRFMSAMTDNRPGFEEATCTLFAENPPKFAQETADRPEAVRAYASRLAFAERPPQLATAWT